MAGVFFVGPDCAGCGLCREIAPKNFSINSDEGISFVSREPAGPAEEALCVEAMCWCPADAIRCHIAMTPAIKRLRSLPLMAVN
jgi:ferredoxin